MPSACMRLVHHQLCVTAHLPACPPPSLPAPVQAARRHVHSQGGLLAAMWADRDLSSPLVLGLEELLERHLPADHRYSEQHDMPDWAPRLQVGWVSVWSGACSLSLRVERGWESRCRRCIEHAPAASLPAFHHSPTSPLPQLGGHFRMIDFSLFHHSIAIPSYSALLDSLNARGALHATLGSSGRRAFHAGLRRLVDQHSGTGDGPIELPMLTKVYILAAAGNGWAATPAAHAPGSAAAAAAQGSESTCLFCGAAVPSC